MADFVYLEEGDVNYKERVYRPRPDLLATLNDCELRRRYRFDKASIIYITDLIRADILHESSRSHSLCPEIQVMAALRYLGTNAHQLVIGDILGLSQGTVSQCFNKVVDLISAKASAFIKFPVTAIDVQRCQVEFTAIAGFPGVVGCIDCTHIRLMAPIGVDKAQFYCRKGYTSLNVQAVCDAKGRFTNVVAKWPGQCHDSFILRHSDVWGEFEGGRASGIILGDSGYPCRRWLLTPYPNPVTQPQRHFNAAQKKTRCLIEQAFGSVKRRWAILGSLSGCCRLQPAVVAKVFIGYLKIGVYNNFCYTAYRLEVITGFDTKICIGSKHGSIQIFNEQMYFF